MCLSPSPQALLEELPRWTTQEWTAPLHPLLPRLLQPLQQKQAAPLKTLGLPLICCTGI